MVDDPRAPRGRGGAPGAALVLVLLGTAYGLGSYPLLEPDEGRNGEVAREVAEADSWLLPRFDGVPYLDKPLLWFGAAALAARAIGPRELAVRLPSLLFTLATCGLLIGFARRQFGSEAGWVAGLAYAASPLTLAHARIAIFDAMFTFFVAAAILAFYCAREAAPGAIGWAGSRGGTCFPTSQAAPCRGQRRPSSPGGAGPGSQRPTEE